jgi:hypothetical protein
MTKIHAGSGRPHGVLHRGARPTPTPPTHGGTHLPTGQTRRGVQPRIYSLHGGTALRMGVLNKKRQ